MISPWILFHVSNRRERSSKQWSSNWFVYSMLADTIEILSHVGLCVQVCKPIKIEQCSIEEIENTTQHCKVELFFRILRAGSTREHNVIQNTIILRPCLVKPFLTVCAFNPTFIFSDLCHQQTSIHSDHMHHHSLAFFSCRHVSSC